MVFNLVMETEDHNCWSVKERKRKDTNKKEEGEGGEGMQQDKRKKP